MNPYIYNPQASIDRINTQIAELEKMKQQIPSMPQPTNLTQNFQLAPTTSNVIKFANSIEEVQKNMVIGETPYFSNDMSVVWVKDIKGNIRTFELNEIVPLDEKDIEIQYLKAQIEELKGMNKNESNVTNVVTKQATTNTTTDDDENRTTVKKNKSTSIPKISTSKTK